MLFLLLLVVVVVAIRLCCVRLWFSSLYGSYLCVLALVFHYLITSCLSYKWDVTDKDIDKLSMQCMQSTFDPFGCEMEPTLKEKKKHYTNSVSPSSTLDGEGNNTECNSNSSRSVGSIAASLSSARKVCKLQHAVGCAPVIYGVPLKFSL